MTRAAARNATQTALVRILTTNITVDNVADHLNHPSWDALRRTSRRIRYYLPSVRPSRRCQNVLPVNENAHMGTVREPGTTFSGRRRAIGPRLVCPNVGHGTQHGIRSCEGNSMGLGQTHPNADIDVCPVCRYSAARDMRDLQVHYMKMKHIALCEQCSHYHRRKKNGPCECEDEMLGRVLCYDCREKMLLDLVRDAGTKLRNMLNIDTTLMPPAARPYFYQACQWRFPWGGVQNAQTLARDYPFFCMGCMFIKDSQVLPTQRFDKGGVHFGAALCLKCTKIRRPTYPAYAPNAPVTQRERNEGRGIW